MPNKIYLRRRLAAEWIADDTILNDGEPGLEKDTGKFKIGNGIQPWTQLSYAAPYPTTGEIRYFPSAPTDSNWIPCDGEIYLRADYPQLSALRPRNAWEATITPAPEGLWLANFFWTGTRFLCSDISGVAYPTDLYTTTDGVNFTKITNAFTADARYYVAPFVKSNATGRILTMSSVGTRGFYSDDDGATWDECDPFPIAGQPNQEWFGVWNEILGFAYFRRASRDMYTSVDGTNWQYHDMGPLAETTSWLKVISLPQNSMLGMAGGIQFLGDKRISGRIDQSYVDSWASYTFNAFKIVASDDATPVVFGPPGAIPFIAVHPTIIDQTYFSNIWAGVNQFTDAVDVYDSFALIGLHSATVTKGSAGIFPVSDGFLSFEATPAFTSFFGAPSTSRQYISFCDQYANVERVKTNLTEISMPYGGASDWVGDRMIFSSFVMDQELGFLIYNVYFLKEEPTKFNVPSLAPVGGNTPYIYAGT